MRRSFTSRISRTHYRRLRAGHYLAASSRAAESHTPYLRAARLVLVCERSVNSFSISGSRTASNPPAIEDDVQLIFAGRLVVRVVRVALIADNRTQRSTVPFHQHAGAGRKQ